MACRQAGVLQVVEITTGLTAPSSARHGVNLTLR